MCDPAPWKPKKRRPRDAGDGSPGGVLGGPEVLPARERKTTGGHRVGGTRSRRRTKRERREIEPSKGARGAVPRESPYRARTSGRRRKELSPEEAVGGSAASMLQRFGLNLSSVAVDTCWATRKRLARAMHGMMTRGGNTDRGTRIRHCGRLHAACRTHGDGAQEYGVASARCRDRLCPHCASSRAEKMARYVGFFLEHRVGTEHLRQSMAVVTFTQPKRSVRKESASQAVDRVMGSWRRCWNTKTKGGRELRRFYAGGLRALELKFGKRGSKTRAGKVRVTGWHAHFHTLLQLREPEPGISWSLWRLMAERALREAWFEASPGSNVMGWKWEAIRDQRGGDLDESERMLRAAREVVKYPLKFEEADTQKLIRDAADALASRVTVRAFGEWTGSKKEGRLGCMELGKKLCEEAEGKGPVVELSRFDMSHIAIAVHVHGWVDAEVEFSKWVGGQRQTRTVSAELIRLGLREKPGTFRQRDRDKREEEKRRHDDEREAHRDPSAVRQRLGLRHVEVLPAPLGTTGTRVVDCGGSSADGSGSGWVADDARARPGGDDVGRSPGGYLRGPSVGVPPAS